MFYHNPVAAFHPPLTKYTIDSRSREISIILSCDSRESGSNPPPIQPRVRKAASPMAVLGHKVSQGDLRIPKGPGSRVRVWRKALWVIAGVLLWGWGGASPVQAGCGDHFPLSLHREGDHPFSIPWAVEGGLPGEPQSPTPCPGPGCSPTEPTLPPLSFAPPTVAERDKSTAVTAGLSVPWYADDPASPFGFPPSLALLQGAWADIFHPPRL